MFDAASALGSKDALNGLNSGPCQKDLKAISDQSGQALDTQLIQGAAENTNFVDGPTYNLTAPGFGGQTVAQYFKSRPLTDAATVPGMGPAGYYTVFIRSAYFANQFNGGTLQPFTKLMEGTVLHEIMHEFGIQDQTLGDALLGKGNWDPSMATSMFSTRLGEDCIK